MTVKHTKTELKQQKETLYRFYRYLPTLQLKQQQLQLVIHKMKREKEHILLEKQLRDSSLQRWIAVFAEDPVLKSLLTIEKFSLGMHSIAGVDIPIFKTILFQEETIDAFTTPLWVQDACEEMKEHLTASLRLKVLEHAIYLLEEELRITIQRVNLFEKVRIPDTKENIRTIKIFLSDLQTAEVVRGKIAKRKIMERCL